jgi:uncharacterized protein (DUF2147 family)
MRILNSTILAMFVAAACAFGADSRLCGKWHTENDESIVDICPCGKAFCGKIVSLHKPYEKDGTLKKDKKNPDPKLRSRTIAGIEVLNNLTYDANNVWRNGMIYDPRNGKWYKCIATLENDSTLGLRGYVGISLIGRTATWKRVKE